MPGERPGGAAGAPRGPPGAHLGSPEERPRPSGSVPEAFLGRPKPFRTRLRARFAKRRPSDDRILSISETCEPSFHCTGAVFREVSHVLSPTRSDTPKQPEIDPRNDGFRAPNRPKSSARGRFGPPRAAKSSDRSRFGPVERPSRASRAASRPVGASQGRFEQGCLDP